MNAFHIEERQGAAVLWFKGATHRHYEGRHAFAARQETT